MHIIAYVMAGILYCTVVVFLFLPGGCIWGAIVAIKNYVVAFGENIRRQGNPITEAQPAKKNYFFDRRAYQCLGHIISESWGENGVSASNHFARAVAYDDRWKWATIPLFYAAAISIYVFGMVFFLICSIVHISLMGVVVLIVFSLYSLVWLMDAGYRRLKLIFTDCPQCYTRGRLPVYHCPSCNERHDKLYPGAYGILTRTCNCGQRIPTTFFNGRHHLEASCPECGYAIKSKESRPIPIPIVGAPSAGKTYLLHSMVPYIRDDYAPSRGLDFEFMDREAEFNAHLADLDAGKTLPKTVENNPLALNFFLTKGSNRVLMYFYDSAGEAFTTTQHLVQHKFYDYFNGLIFVIDPFSIPDVYHKYESKLLDINVKPSLTPVDDVYETLIINLEKNYNIKPTERISKPTAIVLSKTGVFDLAQNFADAHTADEMDEKCKQFVRDYGEESLLNKIAVKFANVRYFAVDSKGSKSVGVDGVADWLLGQVNKKGARVVA